MVVHSAWGWAGRLLNAGAGRAGAARGSHGLDVGSCKRDEPRYDVLPTRVSSSFATINSLMDNAPAETKRITGRACAFISTALALAATVAFTQRPGLYEADGRWTQLFHVVRYKKLKTGTCKDLGLLPITDRETCSLSGVSLGLSDISVFQSSLTANTEESCFYYQLGQAGLATLWMKPRDSTEPGFQPVCVTSREVAQASPTEESREDVHEVPLAPMSWVGCFAERSRKRDEGLRTMFRRIMRATNATGSTTLACLQHCRNRNFTYMSLGGEGGCSCLVSFDPAEPSIHLMPDGSCGDVCPGEDAQTPKRYCGGLTTLAVYRIKAPAPAPRPSGSIADRAKHFSGTDVVHGSSGLQTSQVPPTVPATPPSKAGEWMAGVPSEILNAITGGPGTGPE